MKATLLFILLSCMIGTCSGLIDYNRLVEWERRTLYCRPSANQVVPGECFLTVGKDGLPKPAACHREVVRNSKGDEELRFSCDIECNGADRDSVISKFPNNNRNCIRFFSYNSQKVESVPAKWSIWRVNKCAMDEISFEIHCGFLTQNNG
ncbi:hypothetical protein M3Y94_00842900 [Aphelenchoides besseyi]|nr:hypothetical protein M3Y94_00842900 [Aphelenchoides besseyi]KAI6226906.1 hypothetical protein M3Y95_00670700 [Aphelenchoides besseyi]